MSTLHSKTMTMEERIARVGKLVRQFREGETFYMSKDFVESEVRSKFIDPLLEYSLIQLTCRTYYIDFILKICYDTRRIVKSKE